MKSENIARNMYSSQGIINYPTQLHLVCHSRILCHDARKHKYQIDEESLKELMFAQFIGFCVLKSYIIHVLTCRRYFLPPSSWWLNLVQSNYKVSRFHVKKVKGFWDWEKQVSQKLRKTSYTTLKRLRWSRGSVLASGTQVRGFAPGRSRRNF
jgi:hypothetical protein